MFVYFSPDCVRAHTPHFPLYFPAYCREQLRVFPLIFGLFSDYFLLISCLFSGYFPVIPRLFPAYFPFLFVTFLLTRL